MPGLMLLWDRLFARAAHILQVILALILLQKSDHLLGRCGLCIRRCKAELTLCRSKEESAQLFLLREALPSVTGTGQWGCCLPKNSDSMCRCFGDNGMDKASISCQRRFLCWGSWFQSQKSKSRRAPWVVFVVFFQRRCWFNASCCSVGFSSSQGRRVHGAEPLHNGVQCNGHTCSPSQPTWEMLGAAACQSGWKTLPDSWGGV